MRLLATYQDCDLPLYRLHPVVKMLLSFSFILATGLVSSLSALGVLSAFFLAIWLIAGRGILEIYQLVRPFRFLLIFTFVVQLFLTPTGQWMLPTGGTALYAGFFTLRMALMIAFSSLFAMLTPVTDIVRLFYLIFQPLKLIRISPLDTAMSMLIALRFIPLLFTEGEKIVDSQRIKGILPEKGEKVPLRARLRSAVSLVVPLFVRTFHYADQISITLSYRRGDAGFFRLAKPHFSDILVACLFIALASGVVVAEHVL
jgi:energy-coupling factor transport system permease protein